jgi:hypothetical protein
MVCAQGGASASQSDEQVIATVLHTMRQLESGSSVNDASLRGVALK